MSILAEAVESEWINPKLRSDSSEADIST